MLLFGDSYRSEAWRGGVFAVFAAAAALFRDSVSVGFYVGGGVAGGEAVSVGGEGDGGQGDVGESAGVDVVLEESGGLWSVAAGSEPPRH